MRDIEKNLINLYGEKGREWLANLPQVISQIEKDYGLRNLKPYKNLSYNYLLSGFKGLKPVVLKLAFDSKSLNREAHALKAFAGFGVVTMLIEEEGMLLL